jgi:LuxR family quorum sensing-dependent transcriptional regulator
MTFTSDEYGIRTFAFIEKLQGMTKYEDMQRLIIEELEWYGLTFVTNWAVPGPGEGPDGKVLLNTRPEEYIENYIAKNYVDLDPVMNELRRSLSPFSWSDIKKQRRLSKSERRIMDEAREFESTDGFIIPIVTRAGNTALFSPCGKNPDLSQRARSALEIIGTYSYCALQKAMAEQLRAERQKSAILTPREREIMRWVAAGKTDDEIGEILAIAHATVTSHVENAKIKLNATRRTYAVVQALRLGEITL